jgi:hypothetical protein
MGREARAESVRKCKQCSFVGIVTAPELRDHVAARHGETFKPTPFQKLNPDDIWDRAYPTRRYAHRKTVAEREEYLFAKLAKRIRRLAGTAPSPHPSIPGGLR